MTNAEKAMESDVAASLAPMGGDEWVARHGDYLYRYALIRVRDGSVAEDLVQDTLLAALQSRARYTSGSSERGWLTGILRHKLCDHFRRLSRERTIFQNEDGPDQLEECFDNLGLWKREPALGLAEWAADAPELMQRKEFMAALNQCLAQLPPRCADAFVLREMEGVESDTIQEILGVSAANFWVLLHRARAQLRLCLEKTWSNSGGHTRHAAPTLSQRHEGREGSNNAAVNFDGRNDTNQQNRVHKRTPNTKGTAALCVNHC